MKVAENSIETFILRYLNFCVPKRHFSDVTSIAKSRNLWLARGSIMVVSLSVALNLIELIRVYFFQYSLPKMTSLLVQICIGIGVISLVRLLKKIEHFVLLTIWIESFAAAVLTLASDDLNSIPTKWVPLLLISATFQRNFLLVISTFVIHLSCLALIHFNMNPLQGWIPQQPSPYGNVYEFSMILFAAFFASYCISRSREEALQQIETHKVRALAREANYVSDSELRSLGEIANRVSLEFREPISAIRDALERLKLSNVSGQDKIDAGGFKNIVNSNIEQLVLLTDKMSNLAHAHSKTSTFTTTDVSEILLEVKSRLSLLALEYGTELRVANPRGSHLIKCSVPQVVDALAILVKSALESSRRSEEKWVEIRCVPVDFLVDFHVSYPASASHQQEASNSLSESFRMNRDVFSLDLSVVESTAKLHFGRLLRKDQYVNPTLCLRLPNGIMEEKP